MFDFIHLAKTWYSDHDGSWVGGGKLFHMRGASVAMFYLQCLDSECPAHGNLLAGQPAVNARYTEEHDLLRHLIDVLSV